MTTSSWQEFFVQSDIDTFRNYLSDLEAFIESEFQKEQARFDQLKANGVVDVSNGFSISPDEYHNSELERLDKFANTIRISLFVSLYSYLESQLLDECRTRQSNDVLIKLSDLAGQDGIEKAKVYFTKVLQIRFPSDTRQWVEIQDYARLRNCFIHAQRMIHKIKNEKDREALRKYVTGNSYLTLLDATVIFDEVFDEVHVEKGFCEEVCDTIEEFLLLLYSRMESK